VFGWRAYSLITGVYSLGALIYASVKLFKIIRISEFQLSLPQTVLWMEASAAICMYILDEIPFLQI
jgi:hypothetical protein